MSIDYSKDFFLDDPMLDRVMQVLITVARESYVTKDRLAIIEKHLEDKGILSEGIIDNYKPTDLEEIEIKKRRDEYVSSILRPLVKELLEPDQGRKIKE